MVGVNKIGRIGGSGGEDKGSLCGKPLGGMDSASRSWSPRKEEEGEQASGTPPKAVRRN